MPSKSGVYAVVVTDNDGSQVIETVHTSEIQALRLAVDHVDHDATVVHLQFGETVIEALERKKAKPASKAAPKVADAAKDKQ